jgi:large subunit ribosomal protein L13
MEKLIIDGEGAVFGRLCSYAAKQALEGKEIIILNSEKVIITGNRNNIIKKYIKLKGLGGTAQKGPYYSRVAFMILKRAIRGMLPDHRLGIGKQAFSRIKCYNGIPKEYEGQKLIKFPGTKNNKFIEVKEVIKNI